MPCISSHELNKNTFKINYHLTIFQASAKLFQFSEEHILPSEQDFLNQKTECFAVLQFQTMMSFMPTQIDCVTIETINDNDNNNLLYKLVIFIFFNLGTRITGA